MIFDKSFNAYCIKEPITETEIIDLVSDSNCKRLIASGMLEMKSWSIINEILFSNRKDITLVATVDYPGVLDFNFVSLLSNIENFCVRADKSINPELVGTMKNLRSLSLYAIGSVTSLEFLEGLNAELLEELEVGVTKANIDLSVLKRFKNLKKLKLEYHKKNIESLSELENLEELFLYQVPVSNVNFLSNLKKLLSLKVILGKYSDFSGIKGIDSLRYLELYQLRNLTDIEFISELSGLQYVFLGNLPKVDRLPDFSKLNKLRRIYLDNLKSLKDFNMLKTAPNLEEFALVKAFNNEPEDLELLLTLPKLKAVNVAFGYIKKNERFDKMIEGTHLKTGVDELVFDFV
jgi:hypothetical protein